MEVDWFILTAQILNFLILLALLRRFLYQPILKVMKNREEQVLNRLEEARARMKDAEQKHEQYERELQQFELQKKKIMKEARQEVEDQRSVWMEQSRNEVNRLQERWEDAIQKQKETYQKSVKKQAAEHIISIMDHMIRSLSGKEIEELVVRHFLNELRQMDRLEAKRIIQRALDSGTGELQVFTTFSLSDDLQNEIRQTLEQVLVPGINCSFHTSDEQGMGIELRTSSWKMGWNSNSYLKQLEEDLRREQMNTKQGSEWEEPHASESLF